MKKQWIYLEPFVFVWQDNKHFLFYNSLNGDKIFVLKNNTINPIIQSLIIEKNAYCAEVRERIKDKQEYKEFVKTLSLNQLGNVVISSDSERPVNLPPILTMRQSVENSKKNNTEYHDPLILENINELTVQINGKCNFNCKNCGEYDFQLIHCSKSEHNLAWEKIENLVKQAKNLDLQKINVTGGDLLAMKNFELLVDILSSIGVLKIYNIHFNHISPGKIQYVLEKDITALVRIIVHCDISEDELVNQIKILERNRLKLLWTFIVSSSTELEFYYSILEKCESIQSEVKPFYNKNNEAFIREFVFVDNEDIFNMNPYKRQIFANQVINSNYFGKLTIQANGDISDNINFGSVGNIDDYLEKIIYKIILEGRSWRWVRNNEICNSCLYKLICPPPSNLELVMDSKTICQKPYSYKTN